MDVKIIKAGKEMDERKIEYELKLKKIIIVTVVIFILLLVPLYIIAFYAHPSVDDYFYGINTVKKWKETHSFLETCKMSLKNTKEVYRNWQGNFWGIFLMGLQPAIFGEKKYVWTTIIILTVFVSSNLFFYNQLMLRFLKKDKKLIFFLSMVITMTALQFTYNPVDSFYWYNGGIYYTFFYSLSIFLYGIVLAKDGMHGIKHFLFIVAAMLLSFLVGGGNYATALISVIILFLLCVNSVINGVKKAAELQGKTKENVFLIIENFCLFFIVFIGLMISIFAPGNVVRQEAVGGSSSIIKAIFLSFCYAGYNIATATTLSVVCVWLLIIPLLWRLVPKKKFIIRVDHKYKLCLCILFLFCLFAAQGTPVFYAQGIRIPYRLMNIIYFSYFTFTLMILILVLNWIKQKNIFYGMIKNYQDKTINQKRKYTTIYYSMLIMLFIVSIIGNIKVTEIEKGRIKLEGMPITAEAVYSLITKEAENYSKEADLRIKLYEDSKIQKLEIIKFQNQPYLLYHSDITTDRRHWKNRQLSKYYNKEYIVLQPEN